MWFIIRASAVSATELRVCVGVNWRCDEIPMSQNCKAIYKGYLMVMGNAAGMRFYHGHMCTPFPTTTITSRQQRRQVRLASTFLLGLQLERAIEEWTISKRRMNSAIAFSFLFRKKNRKNNSLYRSINLVPTTNYQLRLPGDFSQSSHIH